MDKNIIVTFIVCVCFDDGRLLVQKNDPLPPHPNSQNITFDLTSLPLISCWISTVLVLNIFLFKLLKTNILLKHAEFFISITRPPSTNPPLIVPETSKLNI